MNESSSGKRGREDHDNGNSLRLSTIAPDVYDELKKIARYYMARERNQATLQPTVLVHEAYLKLRNGKSPAWRNRKHFCAIAAGAMRELLVDKARARAARKRGGSLVRVSLDNAVAADAPEQIDVVLLHEALERLEKIDPESARIVELRFFGGLTVEETADIMGTSSATVKRDWNMPRAWLRRELEKDDGS